MPKITARNLILGARNTIFGLLATLRMFTIWTGTVCLLFWGILSPSYAACTTLPFTLLPGVPPDGAQMMADLNALNSNCAPLGSNSTGIIILIFPIGTTGGTTPGTVITPDGSVVPNIATTKTGGFNEVEAYAFIKGWSVWVIGTGEWSAEGSLPLQSYVLTNDSAGFILKPLANRSLRLTGIQMLCGGAANNGCLNIDSMMKGKIICEGCEIASQAAAMSTTTTFAVLINPHTAVPNEGVIGVTDSTIDLGNVALNPSGGGGTGRAAVGVNIGTGGVNLTRIVANELNDAGAGAVAAGLYNFQVYGANGSFSFAGNLIEINHPHLATNASIQIGSDFPNQASYSGNIWKLGAVFVGTNGAQAINTYGQKDLFQVGTITNGETLSGNYQTPFLAHDGATNNTVQIGAQSGASNGSGCASVIDQTNTVAHPGQPSYTNNYTLNGTVCNALTPTSQVNELAPTSFTAGTGGVCQSGFVCTNHRGTIDVGTGNPTSITVSFSVVYLIAPKCAVFANTNGLSFYRSALTAGAGGYTGIQYSTNGATTMAQHTQVDYECQ